MVSEDIAAITDQFAPISLEAINTRASLQVRADNKYFLTWPMFNEFMTSLRHSHAIMEIGGQRAFAYDTQYFDTVGLANYWSHMQERRKRFKCRCRNYVDSGLHVFEIKLKGGRGETIKHKIGYSADDWGGVSPAASTFLQNHLANSYGMALTEQMVPTLRTLYRRITLAALDSTERITCDIDLLLGTHDAWHGRMAREYVLIETKSESGRGAIDHILWRMGARPTPGSKYCLGMSLLRPELRSNPFQHVRKTYFVRDADAALPQQPIEAVERPRLTPHQTYQPAPAIPAFGMASAD